MKWNERHARWILFRQTFCWNQSTSCCPSFTWSATHPCQKDVFLGVRRLPLSRLFEEIKFGSRWCQELSADFKLDIHFKSHWTNRCRTDKETSGRFNLMPPLQSAYRAGHSTKTALIKVISDIIDVAYRQKVTLLGLLNTSAAFDTIDHDILLHRLEMSYGIRGGHFGGSPPS